MGWLGLDWGNVPGWFSAGSFMAAAYVISRDRQHRKRQQVDGVGIWGEFDLCQDEESIEFGFIIPRIHIKNAGVLPVYLERAVYEVSYTWAVEANGGYFYPDFEAKSGKFSGRISDVVVPPGQEVVVCGVDRRPVECRRSFGNSGITSRAPGNRLTIGEFVIVDNAHRRWKVVPGAGLGKVAVSGVRAWRFPGRFRPTP